MACFFGHKWNGCKCSRCGTTRNENHLWNGCVCAICGNKNPDVSVNHDWRNDSNYFNDEYCICKKCGFKKPHNFVSNSNPNIPTIARSCEARCSFCGYVKSFERHDLNNKCRCNNCRATIHSPQNCVCTVCGKEAHDFEYKYDYEESDFYEKEGKYTNQRYECKICGKRVKVKQ